VSRSLAHADHQQPEPPLGHRLVKYPLIGRLFRFLSWCFVFTGIYASSSVCPFCGRVVCPEGGVSAGEVGAFFALVMAKGLGLLNYLAGLLALIRAKMRTNSQTQATKLQGKP
jgi:hypothetical protein